ncbi:MULTISPECIES: helix-turn-helix domain-containing protein [Kordiimonas]|uniref:helix-turn-helix domain-containing protein n=1 Tax=Kordiimonas TaxID=288021 RepID=UPI001FF14E4F|nr:helix-turn-helix transcriptional regulator [Kordiimonas sp. SCSIO 12603]MCK0070333.1 helix-turn-helix transcriptional regulator [Kordiimonas laminariae]UTW58894.1 helix-turn-helix transcriptional regulator [Kordiimonas sp. SCSIO 12603]
MQINAALIKENRNAKSWTQQHLAEACDLSLRTVQRVERLGVASPETVLSLCAVLEIPQKQIIVEDTASKAGLNIDPLLLVVVAFAFGMGLAIGIVL